MSETGNERDSFFERTDPNRPLFPADFDIMEGEVSEPFTSIKKLIQSLKKPFKKRGEEETP